MTKETLLTKLQQLDERLRPGHVLEQRHALVVLQAVGLHLGDRLAARRMLLGEEDLAWRVEDRLDHRDDVEGVRR